MHDPLIVSIRANLVQGLFNMISDGTEAPVLFPVELRDEHTGERVYSQQHTGNTWLLAQVSGFTWHMLDSLSGQHMYDI